MSSITPRGTIQPRHLSLNGGIKNEIFEKTCECCSDRFETTVPHAEVCRKASCVAWRRRKNDSNKNSRVKDLRERVRAMRKALVQAREALTKAKYHGPAFQMINEALGVEDDG